MISRPQELRPQQSLRRHGSAAGCALALLATLVSGALVLRAQVLQPRREVELGGLRLRLEQATWLHEPMDHGDPVPLPPSEGAPRPGERRLVVELTLFNPMGDAREFSAQELVLIAGDGQRWLPVRTEQGSLTLPPAQLLRLPLNFNVPVSAGVLRLEWVRGSARSVLLSARPPPSAAASSEGLGRWPQRAEELPRGTSAAGATLFHGRFACVTCHGEPSVPGSRHIGPALHDFAKVGATRIAGMTAAQYAYESMLFPGAFIVSGCTGDGPCEPPGPMPVYGEVLSPQEMADLISYLLEQGRQP